jgi:FAD/FMN-containing dehydrogenase
MKSAWLLLLAATAVAFGQTQASDEKALSGAEIAAWNIQECISHHLVEDAPNFHPAKQEPEDDASLPSMMLRKDGSAFDPATVGQQARALMEELRQGIHALQSAEKAEGMDAMALYQARASWPQMRDIFCREYPEVRYYDLDGIERHCPPKPPAAH